MPVLLLSSGKKRSRHLCLVPIIQNYLSCFDHSSHLPTHGQGRSVVTCPTSDVAWIICRGASTRAGPERDQLLLLPRDPEGGDRPCAGDDPSKKSCRGSRKTLRSFVHVKKRGSIGYFKNELLCGLESRQICPCHSCGASNIAS